MLKFVLGTSKDSSLEIRHLLVHFAYGLLQISLPNPPAYIEVCNDKSSRSRTRLIIIHAQLKRDAVFLICGDERLSKEYEIAFSEPDSDRLVQEFVSRGIVILTPESLGIPLEIHDRLYKKEKTAYLADKPISPVTIPEVLEVLNAPGLVAACNRLVGDNWAVVPFTHNAHFASGPSDQQWHKDDNGPLNARKQRHHQAIQIEMLYYPQMVREDMGPTATIPYSHYWTFNHEENQDNFCGADHLDFNYHLSGMESEPASGPNCKYDFDDMVNRRTPHDIRMREAVTKTGWPLVQSFEAAPLRAGSIVLYSHNLFHRGNHRRDNWKTWQDNPRFMWRFWLYRTTDPFPCSNETLMEASWFEPSVDPLTKIDLSHVDEDVTSVWRYHYYWIKTGQSLPSKPKTLETPSLARQKEAEHLFAQLYAKTDDKEPTRIGAAYRLASLGNISLSIRLLGQALYDDRENVRRAATYGLIAVGPEATRTFLEGATSPVKWVRKASIYGLGDTAPLNDEVLQAVIGRLENDPSVYVRSVSAGSLGCLGRRAIATGIGQSLVPACLDALVESLSHEEHRPCASQTQERSINLARPTDDSDMCEGAGGDFGLDRFDPVRSAVRENALWSIVILCSHGAEVVGPALKTAIESLKGVIREDRNVICVGFAMDALNRIANLRRKGKEMPPLIDELQADLPSILGQSPVQAWEALVRSSSSIRERVAQFDSPV